MGSNTRRSDPFDHLTPSNRWSFRAGEMVGAAGFEPTTTSPPVIGAPARPVRGVRPMSPTSTSEVGV